MQTCPNCGSIVMRGDPYCTHCGATLRWYFNEEEEDYEPPEEDKKSKLHEIFNIMRESDMTTDERFDLFSKYIFMTDYLLDEIRQSIHDEEKMYKCRFIMIHTETYPQVYIFFREDKYRDVLIFNRCYIEYSPGQFDPEEREFHYIYTKLYNEEKFQLRRNHISHRNIKQLCRKQRNRKIPCSRMWRRRQDEGWQQDILLKS